MRKAGMVWPESIAAVSNVAIPLNKIKAMDIADYMETEYNSYGWNETDIVRSEVYEQESWNSTRAGSHVQKIFAEELVALCVRHDFLTYRELRSERPRNEGSGSQEDNRNYRFEHDGSGDGQENRGVELSCSPKALSPAGQRVLLPDSSEFKFGAITKADQTDSAATSKDGRQQRIASAFTSIVTHEADGSTLPLCSYSSAAWKRFHPQTNKKKWSRPQSGQPFGRQRTAH